jgi:broad specificity phosphatase PhoE
MRNGNKDPDRRKKRIRRRIQIVVIYTAIAVGLAWFFESQATTTMIFVRHAEKALIPVDDPGLSPEGQARAEELARQLVDADVVAGIDAIYSTDTRRTRETAVPVAEALGLDIRTYTNQEDDEPVVDAMVRDNKGKIILVVGHSNTLPTMIAALGASKKVPPIAEMEYDNLYLISIPWFGKTKTIRLRYGEPYTGDPVDESYPGLTMSK